MNAISADAAVKLPQTYDVDLLLRDLQTLRDVPTAPQPGPVAGASTTPAAAALSTAPMAFASHALRCSPSCTSCARPFAVSSMRQLRRSAGRRVRTTGAPARCAAL